MGAKGSKPTTQQQSTSYTPNAQALSQYSDILGRLNSLPFGSYTGQLTAPVNDQQMAGVGNVNQYAEFAQPGIAAAQGYAQNAAQPLTQAQIQQYQNPYTDAVVDKTMSAFDRQNQMGLTALRGNAAAQGALGGNRVGIAESNYLTGQQTAQAPIIAGLYSDAYKQGVGVAADQFQANPLRAAQATGNLALGGQQAGLTGAQAQYGVGTGLQESEQRALTAALQNWLLPYGQLGSQSQIAAGVGSQMGGTGNMNGVTTPPAPDQFGQYAGLAIAAMGMMSDERAKEDVQKVGELNDGQPIYRYRYKGDPRWQIGLIAQEVERSHPEAVTRGVGNMRMVNYKSATEDAVERWRGGPVRGFAPGGVPQSPMFSLPSGYSVPAALPGVMAPQAADWRSQIRFMDAPRTAPAPTAGFSPEALKGAAMGIKDMGTKVRDWWDTATPMENYAPAQDVTNPNYAVGPELPAFYENSIGALGPFARGGAIRHRRGFDVGGVPTLNGITGGLIPEAMAFEDRFRSSALPPAVGEQVNVPLPSPRPEVPGFAPAPPVAAAPTPQPMDQYARALANIESGGKYDAVGPQTRTGDRAYGKYQVMGANIPEWTLAVLGKTMTAPEFLASPEAQEAVFQAKFGALKDKHGPVGAAKAWFAGERGMNDPNRKDILGTTVASYGDKFAKALGIEQPAAAPVAGVAAPADVAADEAALPPNATPAQAPTPGFGPLSAFNPLNMSEEAKLGMIAAGLGMMSSPALYAGQQVGQGGLQGIKAYSEARGLKRLEEQATQAQRKLDEQERHHRATEQRTATAPIKIGSDRFGDIYGIRDPNNPGKYLIIDPATGAPKSGVPSVAPGEPVPTPTPAPGSPAPATPPAVGTDQIAEDDRLPPLAQPATALIGSINDPILMPRKNPDALEGLSQADKTRIIAIAEGRLPMPTVKGRNDKQNQFYIDKVGEYNPDYDATVYPSRQRTANEFKVGMAGRNLTATKTLAGHLEDLHKLALELDNSNVPAWNAAVQAVGRNVPVMEGYQEKIKKYELQSKVVADEAAKVFAGSQSALADRVHWEKLFDVGNGKAAQLAAVKQLVRQVDSRLDALASQYNNGMMTGRQPGDMIEKKFRDIFDRLRDAKDDAPKPDAPKADAPKRTAQDDQAIAWAQANKDDARAKAILKKFGVE